MDIYLHKELKRGLNFPVLALGNSYTVSYTAFNLPTLK